MSTAIIKADEYSIIEQVVIGGDLGRLSADQRVQYYNRVCESMALNPFTRPFDYITLNGKLTLYAKKDCAEQLRKIHGISITGLDGRFVEDLYIVVATAVDRNGRTDQATGAVSIGGLKGEAKANAIMKAETKSKRRVTLSIAGLGWTDESEVDSIPGAQRVSVNMETGEIIQQAPVQPVHRALIAQASEMIEDKPALSANGGGAGFTVDEKLHSTALDIIEAANLKAPGMAQSWAVQQGYRTNEHSARTAWMQMITDQFGGASMKPPQIKEAIVAYIELCLLDGKKEPVAAQEGK